jgi:hypothetical protein
VLSVTGGDIGELAKASGVRVPQASRSAWPSLVGKRSDAYGRPVGTIAQKAVDGAASLSAHTVHIRGRRA